MHGEIKPDRYNVSGLKMVLEDDNERLIPYKCSECGHTMWFTSMELVSSRINFCSKCGEDSFDEYGKEALVMPLSYTFTENKRSFMSSLIFGEKHKGKISELTYEER